MGDSELIDKQIAEAIYVGIVTDTGSFSFAANNEKTYHITASLISKGVDAAGAQLPSAITSILLSNS